jgi:hypothetical protein
MIFTQAIIFFFFPENLCANKKVMGIIFFRMFELFKLCFYFLGK